MKTPDNFFNEELLHKISQDNVVVPKTEGVRASNTQIFIVGLSMGNQKTNDQRSFSGWGMFMAEEKADGNVFEYNQFNNLFNCDTVEATLNGAVQAIERLRNKHDLSIVFQDAYLPLMLASSNFASLEQGNVDNSPEKNSFYWRAQRRLKIYDRFMAAIENSRSINSLSVRYSNPKSHAESIQENQVFSDKDGIEIAQASAQEGFRKAIRASFYYLVNNDGKKDLGSSIVTLRKNLNNSYASTKEFLTFLSSYNDLEKNLHLVAKVLRPQLSPVLDQLRSAENSDQVEAVFTANKPKILRLLEISDEYADKEMDMGKVGLVPELENS